MGAESFIHNAEGENVKAAFSLVYECEGYERGFGSYNGSITTCSLGKCTKSFLTYSPKNHKEALKLIERDHGGEKWTANYIDLGVKKYVVCRAKKKNTTYDAKCKQRYAVFANGESTGHNYDTKPKADAKAIELLLKSPNNSYTVKKTMVKMQGNDTVTSFLTESKEYNKRPKIKTSSTVSIKEIHEYIFYGWASC